MDATVFQQSLNLLGRTRFFRPFTARFGSPENAHTVAAKDQSTLSDLDLIQAKHLRMGAAATSATAAATVTEGSFQRLTRDSLSRGGNFAEQNQQTFGRSPSR